MDDLGPHFLVLAPGDPHLLEGLEGREDGPADPDRVYEQLVFMKARPFLFP